MEKTGEQEQHNLTQRISRVLSETLTSSTTHPRKLKELSAIRSSLNLQHFADAFYKALTPLFQFQRRTDASQRAVRFLSIFATARNSANASACDEFLENFLRFLLVASSSANKTARFRACQIISEVIMQLPDDAGVSNDLWDEVIRCMMIRVEDKISMIRTFAVRALSRFANDSVDCEVLQLLLLAHSLEHSADVRKTLFLSLPPSKVTLEVVIDSTLDVSELVRKVAYRVLSSKFPLQSLSIKHRTTILERGLTDRSKFVTKECLKLLKDEWLAKCCNGDPIGILSYLDVETYESVGELVMSALLNSSSVKLKDGQSIKEFVISSSVKSQGESESRNSHLMEPEVALYWRTVCKHLLAEAQAKGSDAAGAMGTEAAVYAAEATDTNDLLERVLPENVSDYVELVNTHLTAGPTYRFSSRQLLLLGAMLDFSDSMNRKVATAFVRSLLYRPLEHETDDDGNLVIVGDGINVGGDKDWANAVANLAGKVHAAAGEYEEIFLSVVADLARPCRERTADHMQWMHCLAIVGLLLETSRSYSRLQGKAIEPAELLQSLLLPGAKHVQLDVQRVAIRCLGLFGLLEKKPSEELIKQLRLSFEGGPSPISVMACKALIDLALWFGPQELDRAIGEKKLSSIFIDVPTDSIPADSIDTSCDLNIGLLDLLYAGFDKKDCEELSETFENETVQEVIGEGFAKMLLLSPNYSSISSSFHPLVLAKLICLYFNTENKDLQRLKQCLSVFFEHYPSVSINHKKYLSEAFIPVMRSMWPGINVDTGVSKFIVSGMRKRAIQASRFMLQMIQAPLYQKMDDKEIGIMELPETLESGEVGLAIRIGTEVANFPLKKTAAEKAYVVALSKVIILLRLRSVEEPKTNKLLSRLLSRVVECASGDKEVVKELRALILRLKALDSSPDVELSIDDANLILGRLGVTLEFEWDDGSGNVEMPPTPCPPGSTKPVSTRRRRVRRRREEVCSDDEDVNEEEEQVFESYVPSSVGGGDAIARSRTQRASKAAAKTKLALSFEEGEEKVEKDEEEEDEGDEEDEEDEEDEDEQEQEDDGDDDVESHHSSS